MKRNWKKISAACALSFLLIGAAIPAFANDDDPLVSLSYLNQRLEAIEKKLSQAPVVGGESNTLEVVDLKAGEKVIVAQGAELIPRSGRVEIIAAESGGLSDVTGGGDLKEGENAPVNHLLIAPRSDGRGVKAATHAIVLVRGSYRVVPNN
ncbi:MAG: hypothetical protein SOW18_02800 [Peptoniphilus sp.]|nr:hypothetical protein [Peptoniphilus sp.]MDY3118449.1 hypothetical protein [Peptoniphilus sp.]